MGLFPNEKTKDKSLSLISSFTSLPCTNEQTIIFPYNKKTRIFDDSFYSTSLTDGRATIGEVNNFLNQVEIIIKQRKGSITSAACLVVSLVLIMVSGLALYNGNFFNVEYDIAYIALAGYLCFILLNAEVLRIYNNYRRRKVRRYVHDLIARNSDIFESRGLRWNLPMSFPAWIELCKDYREIDESVESDVKIPVDVLYKVKGEAVYGQKNQGVGNYQEEDMYMPPYMNHVDV